MIILYNNDYFERLWCCFELAAQASKDGDLVLIPLWRAPTCILMVVFTKLGHVVEWLGCLQGATGVHHFVTSPLLQILPFGVIISSIVMATRQKLKLMQQLKGRRRRWLRPRP